MAPPVGIEPTTQRLTVACSATELQGNTRGIINNTKQFDNRSVTLRRMSQTVSIIIPCYNEKNTLKDIVLGVQNSPISLKKEIIVIDDGSSQDTKNWILSEISPLISKFINIPQNRGKGYAIRQGLSAATGDIVIIQDADLEYHPNDFPKLLEPILNGQGKVVYGSRFSKQGSTQNKGYRINFFGNKILTWLCNLITGYALTDMETGYKVMHKSVYSQLKLNENRFGIEPEITVKLSNHNITIIEVPISYTPRGYEEGKKIKWRDGIFAILCMLKYKIKK